LILAIYTLITSIILHKIKKGKEGKIMNLWRWHFTSFANFINGGGYHGAQEHLQKIIGH